MKYCKCNLCGKKFQPEDHAVGYVEFSVYDSNHSSWPNGLNIDLCAECTKKAEKFFKVKE